MLNEVCGESTADKSTASSWASRFRNGSGSMDDDVPLGKPKTVTDKQGSNLWQMILKKFEDHDLEKNHHMTLVGLSEATGISPASVFQILKDDL